MKRKVVVLIALIIISSSVLKAQKILTLDECYNMAMSASSLASEKDTYTDIWKMKDQNLSKSWLPQFDANGSAVYNSDVVNLKENFASLPIPGLTDAIGLMPKDQYKFTIDINQVIYDGGAVKGARKIEKAELDINGKQTEIDLYKLRSQVNMYYFGILLYEHNEQLLNNYLEILKKKIASMESAINNGVSLKSDIDVLTSEMLKTEQQISETAIRRKSMIQLLADITGAEIDNTTELVVPLVSNQPANEILRPELQMFDLRKNQLDASLGLIQSKRMPKVFGFATLGYGNPPGQNFFKSEFDTYYIVGGGIKWNIFDWSKTKNEKQVISLQQGIIDNRKKEMTDNLKRLLNSKEADINSLNELTQTDVRQISLRKNITASAESKYQNGTITATEYLSELNSEKQAMINYEIHKINLALAKVEYLNISGKEIEQHPGN
jgi:outer membrane protein TolC